jgi:ATP-dependent Clp protease ATP-binding subunit ClpA
MEPSIVDLAGTAAQREEPGRALAAIAELRARLEEIEEFQVENARDQGWSWSEIAQPLRITRQAAHRKYAKRLAAGPRAAGKRRVVVHAEARRCVARARREARALGHESAGTEHLLLGVLGEKTAARAVAGLGLSLAQARRVAAELRTREAAAAAETAQAGSTPISAWARRALEQSLQEALRLGAAEIRAVHILLALLRDEKSGARVVLDRLEVAPEAVEAALGA